MKKRLLSTLLVLCMVLTMTTVAFADGDYISEGYAFTYATASTEVTSDGMFVTIAGEYTFTISPKVPDGESAGLYLLDTDTFTYSKCEGEWDGDTLTVTLEADKPYYWKHSASTSEVVYTVSFDVPDNDPDESDEPEEPEEPEVPTSGTCGENVTWSYSEGVLTIAGEGDMADYDPQNVESVLPWDEFLDEILTVNIGNGVTSIGDGAFQDCVSLTKVTIPASVTSIGSWAFAWCSSLTEVTIPDKVTDIWLCAFNGCESLASVTIPASVTNIDEGAFDGCDELADVYYGGTEEQWDEISIGEDNDPLLEAEIHFVDDDDTEDPGDVPSFSDVDEGEYYYNAVIWAAGKDITNGYPDGTFRPNTKCSRAQIVTFLWRAYGKQEPTTTENPFTDVPDDEYYTKAVLWAVENGITNGYPDGTFNPNGDCTRAQAVTFQWRAADKPEVTDGSSFIDVAEGQYYADAVAWAAANKIATGIGNNQFGPGNTCTRGQIVTFLFRDLAAEG